MSSSASAAADEASLSPIARLRHAFLQCDDALGKKNERHHKQGEPAKPDHKENTNAKSNQHKHGKHRDEQAVYGLTPIPPFCDGCDGLVEVVSAFGVALSMAKDDVREKSEIVRRLVDEHTLNRQRGDGSKSGQKEHVNDLLTVGDMVRGEIAQHCGAPSSDSHREKRPKEEMKPLYAFAKAHPHQCFTRTLLRLCWAVEFTVAIIEEMGKSRDASVRDCAASAYASTLAAKHPWHIRTGVKAALFALPHRDTLLERLGCTDEPEHLYSVVMHVRPVVADLRGLFDHLNLHDLP